MRIFPFFNELNLVTLSMFARNIRLREKKCFDWRSFFNSESSLAALECILLKSQRELQQLLDGCLQHLESSI